MVDLWPNRSENVCRPTSPIVNIMSEELCSLEDTQLDIRAATKDKQSHHIEDLLNHGGSIDLSQLSSIQSVGGFDLLINNGRADVARTRRQRPLRDLEPEWLPTVFDDIYWWETPPGQPYEPKSWVAVEDAASVLPDHAETFDLLHR